MRASAPYLAMGVVGLLVVGVRAPLVDLDDAGVDQHETYQHFAQQLLANHNTAPVPSSAPW
ncbi:hypothetical protein ACH4TE_19975 [Streptomyces sioyaensis]|uniref:hypothetical protein n=1 Tax=Streptomyces sioyaensis TaxID=67364 RepID=UPI0037B1D47B